MLTSDVAEQVAAAETVWHSADTTWMGCAPHGAHPIALPAGIVELSAEDLVVTVATGTRVSDLVAELGARNLRLGLGQTPFASGEMTVAESIALSLPHFDEATTGTWREWILGCTIVLGDGVVAKSGSRAVKSVAGYDAHKLPVGARGALGIVVEVHLRLYAGKGQWDTTVQLPRDPWIARVLPSDFEDVVSSCTPLQTDPCTATLWGDGPLPELPEPNWLLRPGPPPVRETELPFLQRAKALMDPEGKLNPGALF